MMPPPRFAWAILALACLMHEASALTLGRVRGAALVGQPFEAAISVELGQGEAATALCPEADVFYADTRVAPDRVRVLATAGAGQTAVVRVSAGVPIDEPVVTVYVRVGCDQRISRRYVLLADVASEPAAVTLPSVNTASAQAPVLPSVAPTPAQAVAAVAASPAVPAPATGGNLPTTESTANTSGQARATAQQAPAPAPAPKTAPARKPVVKREPKATEAPKPPVAKAAAPAVVDASKAAAAQEPPKEAAKAATKEPAKETAKEPAKEAPKDSKKEAAKTPAKQDKQEKAAAGEQAGQSRLKLDPLLTLSERVAALEVANAAPPADMAKEMQRVQSLEDSVKALVTLAQKNEATMVEMRARLAKAEEERVSMQWIYLLGAALLAALGAIAYLFLRGNRASAAAAPGQSNWWAEAGEAGGASARGRASTLPRDDAGEMGTTPVRPAAPGARTAQPDSGARAAQFPAGGQASVIDELQEARTSQFNTAQGVERGGAAQNSRSQSQAGGGQDDVDVSLVEMSESNFDQLMQSGQAHGAVRSGPLAKQNDVMATRVQPMELARPINSDQIFDVRQQAAFFVSVGQPDQAVRVLEEAMARTPASSPHYYLDLMSVLHAQGLERDYERVRSDFNLLFNSEAPAFAQFGQEGRDLTDYPHVLSHVGKLWHAGKAQRAIEASVLRDPADVQGKPFDLAAFRDLLLLHAVALTLQKEGPPSGIMPLAVAERAALAGGGAAAGVDISLDSQDGNVAADVDLDLDLSDVVAPALPAVAAIASVPATAPSKAKPVAAAAPAAPKVAAEEPGEHIELPTLAPEFGGPPVQETPKQGLVDNNFLDFDTDKTVKYTLPGQKK